MVPTAHPDWNLSLCWWPQGPMPSENNGSATPHIGPHPHPYPPTTHPHHTHTGNGSQKWSRVLSLALIGYKPLAGLVVRTTWRFSAYETPGVSQGTNHMAHLRLVLGKHGLNTYGQRC